MGDNSKSSSFSVFCCGSFDTFDRRVEVDGTLRTILHAYARKIFYKSKSGSKVAKTFLCINLVA